ncbi:MAG: insulinase family protein, partial [Romboutsia sp.]|nr:insulinase family protein [Romboutsia sp.]
MFIQKGNDNNKSFNICFHTPSPEKSGTTHILEHIVLGGSKKFPVKDPFFEVIKGSQANQINASTYEYKTKYYFSTTNAKDFENLLDIYLDSVFDPLLSFETFSREGYREIYSKETGRIEPQGIVYNEMQAVLDSVDFIIGKSNVQTLLPQYNYDFGGNPEHIHEITHEKIIDYYGKYYHPTNAHITFYGDEFDFDSISQKLDEYLAKYEYKQVEKNPIVVKNHKLEHDLVQF